MRPEYPQALLKSENSGENEANFFGVPKFVRSNLLEAENQFAEKCFLDEEKMCHEDKCATKLWRSATLFVDRRHK